MHLDELKSEKQKLVRQMEDEIQMVRSEYSPKIKALTFQIESILGPPKKKKVFSNQNSRAMMRAAKQLR